MRPTETKEVSSLADEIIARVAALSRTDTATIRKIRREFTRRLAKTKSELIVELALNLLRRSELVYRVLAYELVQHHRDANRSLNAKSLEELGRGIDNWVAVDTFASYLAGPAWRERQVSDALIRRWARSKDRWWRRAAVVSTVALNNQARGGSGDTVRTLMICAFLIADRDDMVEKALSWALRELSKRDPKSVSKFLKEHEGALASRVVREVSNKLRTGLKNPHKQTT